MASALYSQDLTCPICRTIFTDPVNLLCGHSFCRECITDVLSSQHRCPQCGTAVPTEGERLPTIHILKSLVEKAKEAEKVKKEKEKAEAAELCLEHEEKLKLFCVTDQQLACIICRDGERHEGHKFKPIKEAAASLRQELEKGMENLRGDILDTESLANTQREEITQNKKKSQQLMTQICKQFEEMHQFLRKREDEIKNELKHKEEDDAEKMRERLNAIETALSESRELEGKLTSVLEIEDSARLLKSWTECNSRMSPEHVYRPKANDLKVENTSLSLGPYESHLQFFIWKEMLQVIQPRAELLSLKSNSTDITVSDDGRSLFSTPESNQVPSGYLSGLSLTIGSGQGSVFGQPAFTESDKAQSFGSGFGSTTGSGQSTLFGQSAFTESGKAQSFGSGFGSTTGSGQSTLFGQSAFTESGKAQSFGSGFGSTTGSGQGTLFGQSAFTESGKAQSFGSGFGSGFGSTTGSGQSTLFGQSAFTESGKAQSFGSGFGSGFGSTTGSGQNTAFDQGTFTGSGQPPNLGCGVTSSSTITRVFSVNEFTSGQHYWEIEVGHRDYWELGIKDNFLKYDGKKYVTCHPDKTSQLVFGDRPRKIGIYLNCASKKLSFYDADNMTRIHAMSSPSMSMPLSAYFNIRVRAPDPNPLTVCWY